MSGRAGSRTEQWHGTVPVLCRWARSILFDEEAGQNTTISFALTCDEEVWEGNWSVYTNSSDEDSEEPEEDNEADGGGAANQHRGEKRST